ncbi:NHL repeat-containing protein [Spongiivirga citrea]|uniref:6-bladed beta-propeller n=1 Tax=Spongiivirga citrea TaxID=1481457 RepID=A0A6M0CFS4_9FLAO|nr:NHL repeat-containing protein [Spongiivirga citrea]NER16292.1 hypothetical protein [Spongiivirga citrea]
MKNHIIYIAIALLITSCNTKTKEVSWQHANTTKLDGVNPIGITINNEGTWLSDGDHNRLVLINKEGEIVRTIDSLERPMHIASTEKEILIPQYGNDQITIIKGDNHSNLILNDSLDAPAGVAVYRNEKAIADFYNNRILYSADSGNYISFGTEGKGEGELYYPTDVHITKEYIWVADAYNNRIQVFDKEGKFKMMIGEDQKMNAATGIFVSDKEVFITDFENSRVLVFTLEGVLKQVLETAIKKPTDVLVKKKKLYITNYRTSELTIYELKPTESTKS